MCLVCFYIDLYVKLLYDEYYKKKHFSHDIQQTIFTTNSKIMPRSSLRITISGRPNKCIFLLFQTIIHLKVPMDLSRN